MNPKPEIPNPMPTDPELSDAEETHKISKDVVARVASTMLAEADRTSEVDALDILSVDASLADPDRTGEVDALDIVSVEAIELPTSRMPTLKAPPRIVLVDSVAPVALRANEPTQIIRRERFWTTERRSALVTSTRSVLATKRARSVMMLAAALGAWAFFASFAIVGGYGAVKILRASRAEAAPVALALPSSADVPALPTDTTRSSDSEVAPLLYSETDNTAAASDAVPSTPLRASTTHSDEIFRRPSKTQVGVLRLPASVSGVLVDGSPQRVSGGALILACGDHRIRPPHSSARVVRVPCGKTVTL